MQRPTIKDVAAEANVSASTVSLVINDKGYVSEEAREYVEAAIKRLKYVPQRAARQLSSQRSGNVGFVLREDHFLRSEPFYTRVFLGTELEAHQQRLYVLLTTIPKEYDPNLHKPRFVSERNVDGVIIAGRVSTTFIEEVKAMNVPIMLIDFAYGGLPTTMIDNHEGARLAVEHLLERGHRRVAFLGTDIDHPSVTARMDGWRLALIRAGITAGDADVITEEVDEPTSKAGYRLGRRLLESEPRPTAVFCANDALALGVLNYARQHGVGVPDDLAIVGFDDVPGAADSMPALTTVRVHKEQLGEVALRHLSDLITQSSSDWKQNQLRMKLSTDLVVRASG